MVAFAYGPWAWPIKHEYMLYGYLLSAHFALAIGYLSSLPKQMRNEVEPRPGGRSLRRLVLLSLVVNAALLVPTAQFRTGSALPPVKEGLSDLGYAYYSVNELHAQGGSPVEYARVLLGPVTFLLVPLLIYYWAELRPILRWLAVVSIVYYLAIYVAIGTNKAIADFVLLLTSLLAARYLAGRLKMTLFRVIAMGTLTAIVVGSFFYFFSLTQSARTSDRHNEAFFAPLNMYADLNNKLISPLPDEYRAPAASLLCYLTQGYYALGLCMEKPFVPMYGVGNSMFLTHNAAKVPGWESVRDKPYPMRLGSEGWDGYGNWASIYPWLASDASFPGTFIVLFLIGRFFAQAWLDTLRTTNIFGVVMFAQFILMLYYFPANNQVMQSGEGTFAFVGTFLIWQITRRRWLGRRKPVALSANRKVMGEAAQLGAEG